jgi:hypothetical protein
MGASQSTEAEQADSGQAPPNWWECCGARSNKVARGQVQYRSGALAVYLACPIGCHDMQCATGSDS